MKIKNDARFKRTRKALHLAFFKLATTRKVGEITVKELTETAQINRTTFYLHYRSTNDIYTDIVSELETNATKCIEEQKENLLDYNFVGFAEVFVKCWDEMFERDKVDFTQEIFHEIKVKVEMTLGKQIFELFKNSALKNNYVSLSNDVINSLIVAFISLIMEWVVSKRKNSITKLCRELRNTIVNGVGKN